MINFESDIGDLHIGITNSSGEIFDFDINGLNRNLTRWFSTPSIVIDLQSLTNLNAARKKVWNVFLDRCWLHREQDWTAHRYDEFNFNCLDFIIIFLYEIGFFDINEETNSNGCIETFQFNKNNSLIINFLKQAFSKDFIEPKFVKCLKYLNILIKLDMKNCFSE